MKKKKKNEQSLTDLECLRSHVFTTECHAFSPSRHSQDAELHAARVLPTRLAISRPAQREVVRLWFWWFLFFLHLLARSKTLGDQDLSWRQLSLWVLCNPNNQKLTDGLSILAAWVPPSWRPIITGPPGEEA